MNRIANSGSQAFMYMWITWREKLKFSGPVPPSSEVSPRNLHFYPLLSQLVLMEVGLRATLLETFIHRITWEWQSEDNGYESSIAIESSFGC